MLKVKYIQYKTLLLALVAILPLQLTLRGLFHIPLLIYFIWFFAFLFLILQKKNSIKLSLFEKGAYLILLLFFIEMLISVVFNYNAILDKNIPFQYYVAKYSAFWDSPVMSSLFAGIIRPFIYFTFCLFLVKLLDNIKNLKTIVNVFIFIALFSSLYSIYQIVAFKYGLPFSSVFSGHQGNIISVLGIRRCEGIFYEPGPQATFLSVVFSLLIFQINKFHSKKERIYLSFVLALVLVTLFVTFSPIGILTPFMAGAVYIVLNFKSIIKKNLSKIIPWGIIFTTTLLALNNVHIGNQTVFESITNKIISSIQVSDNVLTGDDRTVRLEITKHIFMDHKLLGVGPGNDGFYYSLYAPYAIGHLPDKGVALNNNLKILSDSGILGFLCYIALLLYPFVYYIKGAENKTAYSNDYLESLIKSLFTAEFLLVALTFTSQVEFFQPLFWIVYSMLIASLNIKRKRILNTKKKGLCHESNKYLI